jgi:hypothetical protein
MFLLKGIMLCARKLIATGQLSLYPGVIWMVCLATLNLDHNLFGFDKGITIPVKIIKYIHLNVCEMIECKGGFYAFIVKGI